MKINELKNIKNFSFRAKENTISQQQQGKANVVEFSPEYSNATKSLVSAQIHQKNIDELKEELIDELLQKGVFQTRTEAGYFVYYRVGEDNYNLAKTIFDYNYIPKRTAVGIVEKTHKENEAVAQVMVADEEFPVGYMERILMATNNGNIKSALAACKNKQVSKGWVADYLRRINSLTDSAANHILADEIMSTYTREDALNMLTATSATLVDELYTLFEKPHPSSVVMMAGKQDSEKVEMYIKALRILKQDGQFDSEDACSAIFTLSKRNENVFYEMLEELLSDKEIPKKEIAKVVSSQNQDNHHGRKKVFKALKDDSRISKEDLMNIVHLTTNKSANLKVSVYEQLKDNPDFPSEYLGYIIAQAAPISEDLTDSSVLPENFIEGAKKFKEVHKSLLKNPELYINGDEDEADDMIKEIQDFIKENFLDICGLSALLDKETMEMIFRARLENTEEYLQRYSVLTEESLNLPEVFNSKNINGEKFSPKEQIELLDLLYAMSALNMSFDSLERMIAVEKIDVEKLQNDLFLYVLAHCQITQNDFNEEKMKLWDLKYIPYLAQELNEMSEECTSDALENIIFAACVEDDFKEYIQGENEFGWTNCLTEEKFEKMNLDYQAWLNPSKSNEVQFKYIDSNQEKLSQIVAQIEEDIEALRKTPAQGFIDKHFGDCIFEDKFKVNEKYSKNKQSLENFAKNMFELLDNNIFKRTKGNLDNPSKKQNAQLTLTIKSHLEQRLEDIKSADKSKKTRPVDLTIKMWDRNPAHDLFQGNYSTCCIGLTRGNGSAMPSYLGYSAFNMIELVDNSTGKTIGNALCYFAKDKNDEPVFVIDNIEIANKNKLSQEGSLKLRDAILKYSKNLIEEVASTELPVLLGASYNDVPDNDLKDYEAIPSIIGEFNCDEIYVDAYGGWIYPEYWDEDVIEGSLKVLG